MRNKKIISTIAVALIIFTSTSLSACSSNGGSAKTTPASNHIKSVTAINEVFGDGQKVSAVALEYDSEIDTSKLDTSDFTVEGKTVTKVYANTAAEKSDEGANGKYVIAELDTTITSESENGGNGGDGGGGKDQNGNDQQGDSQGASKGGR